MADTNSTTLGTGKKVIDLEALEVFLGLLKKDYVTQKEVESLVDSAVETAIEEDFDFATEDDIKHLFDDTAESSGESESAGS